MGSYFKTKSEIEARFESAFALLKKGEVKKALQRFEKVFRCDPYNAEACYKLAQHFAQKKVVDSALMYLEMGFDLDESFLEKAMSDPQIVKNVDSESLESIEKNKLSRWWQVIKLWPLENEYKDGSVYFQIKPRHQKNIKAWLLGLPERLTRYFSLENKSTLLFKHGADRNYFAYGVLYQALQELSPHVQDIHFLMSSECEVFLDEIKIEKGNFYFYRHFAKDCFNQSKVNYVIQLSKKNPENQGFKSLLSHEFTSKASVWISHLSEKKAKLKAEKALKEAFKYNPHFPEAHYQKACYLKAMGQEKKSRISLRKTLEFDPNHFDALYQLACYAFEEGKDTEVIQYLTRASKIRPDYNRIHFLKGVSFEAVGNLKESKKEYQSDVQTIKAQHAASLLSRASELCERKFFESAGFYYKATIRKAGEQKKELEKKLESGLYSELYLGMLKKNAELLDNAYSGLSYLEGEVKGDHDDAYTVS